MPNSQLYFSLTTGISLALLGAMLASIEVVDWALFAVGCGVTSLALAGRLNQARGDALMTGALQANENEQLRH